MLLCIVNKRLSLVAPIFVCILTLTRYVRLLISIKIANVLDLHFQGQTLESSILSSSYVIISQTVTFMATIGIANKKMHESFQLVYLHLTLVHSKGYGQGHAHFGCEYLANDDR